MFQDREPHWQPQIRTKSRVLHGFLHRQRGFSLTPPRLVIVDSTHETVEQLVCCCPTPITETAVHAPGSGVLQITENVITNLQRFESNRLVDDEI